MSADAMMGDGPNTTFGMHVVIGTESPPSTEKLAKTVGVAFGKKANDLEPPKNVVGPLGYLLPTVAEFKRGPKDGPYVMQGTSVGTRSSKHQDKNYLMILDVDTGSTVNEVGQKIVEAGLLGLIWTTHSFGKSTTEIAEEQFHRWRKKSDRPETDEPDQLKEQLRDYLTEAKRYHDRITCTLSDAKRRLVDGGMKYVVEHAPMAKLRVMFVLNEPFDFTQGASQKVRIEEWKEAYQRVSNWLGIPFDSSCVDPARLFFLPRVPEGAEFGEDKHEIVLFDGEFLDLDTVPGAHREDDLGANFREHDHDDGAGRERKQHDFQTKGLVRFAAVCPDFDIAAFVSDRLPDIVTKQHSATKIECECPNADSHSDGKPDGFCVETFEDRWSAWCLHDGCKQTSDDDRLFWLDMLCQAAEIEDASELREWSASAQANETAQSKLAADIEAMKPGDDPKPLLQRIGDLVDDGIDRERLIKAVSKKTPDVPIGELRKAVIARRKEQQGPNNEAQVSGERAWVFIGGNQEEEIGQTWAAVQTHNTKNPSAPVIYSTSTGLARVALDGKGKPAIEKLERDTLANTLKSVAGFYSMDETGMVRRFLCPSSITSDMLAERTLKARGIPPILNVTTTPRFGSNGKLVVDKGYNPHTEAWYEPDANLQIPEVAEYPAEEDVRKAVALFFDDLLEGFPFRDGRDPPRHEQDVEGLLPGHRRRLYGEASRANALGLFLLPFVRPMISGPTPFHVINKRQPREGAGLLMKLLGCVATGANIKVQTFTQDGDEFRKRITSVMLNPPEILLLDNLEGLIGGQEFKAALTGDDWEDRLLGQNIMVKGEIRWVWAGTGNNVSLAKEIADRSQLITINTGVKKPNLRNDFKHADVEAWARANRGQLVWACLVLIQNWIAQDRPKDYSVRFGGFDDWARTIGGILKCAGVEGFRANADDLQRGVNIESDTMSAFMASWYEQYGTEAVRLGKHDGLGGTDGGLLALIHSRQIVIPGVDPEKTGVARQKLQAWIQERRDAPREIEIQGPLGASQKATVAIRIEFDSHLKSNVYRLEQVEASD